MPIFEYKCNECGHEFDRLVMSKSDPEPECPDCKNNKVTKLISAGNYISGGEQGGFMGSDAGGCAPSGG